VGWGDEIMATGLARGAKERGKRIAFGDGKKIIWGPWSEPMFRYNPNIALPGRERDPDIEWIEHYKGKRLYNSVSPDRTRWIWNMDFRPIPGELFFSEDEMQLYLNIEPGFVLIEPNVPWHKSVAPNKDWGLSRYQAVANQLMADGHRLLQFGHGRHRLSKVKTVYATEFRHALAILSRAALYIGPEGGLHHGSAAVGIPAVVLFGGFIPPQVTGYPTHTNLTGGAEACGSLKTCKHCRKAMAKIGPDEVYDAAIGYLRG
jgi:hypothetical protein